MADDSTGPPLDGLRVADFTRLLPGPFCTMMLADLGADVVKVEDLRSPDYMRWIPPVEGGMNVGFAYLNRGKRSLTVDIRQGRGVEALRRLARWADILGESFRPGVMAAMGLGYDTLAEDNPRLIYCAITGYGQEGEAAARAGHDINYLARSGVASMIGSLPGIQIADVAGGALMATSGILAAVVARAQRGRGQFVDVSMTDGTMALLSMHAAHALYSGTQPVAGEGMLDGGIPAYRYYRCADGACIAVGALEQKFWTRLCDLLGVPELSGDGMAGGDRGQEVQRRLEQIFVSRPRGEWLDLLSREEVCVTPVLDIVEAFEGASHNMLWEVGGLRQPACPLRFSASPLSPGEAAAPLGEHNAEVLAEIGYSAEEIAALQRDKVVGSP